MCRHAYDAMNVLGTKMSKLLASVYSYVLYVNNKSMGNLRVCGSFLSHNSVKSLFLSFPISLTSFISNYDRKMQTYVMWHS